MWYMHLYIVCFTIFYKCIFFCFAADRFLKCFLNYMYNSISYICFLHLRQHLSLWNKMCKDYSDLLFLGINNGFTTRVLGFSVYVSNTTVTTDGKLCFKDTSFNRTTVPAFINITCIVHGQYVIYYNERLPNTIYPSYYSPDAHNELCEVEVYGKSIFFNFTIRHFIGKRYDFCSRSSNSNFINYLFTYVNFL